jgi:ubiquinone/menaquinone biosynthesis C-methylase UbiE
MPQNTPLGRVESLFPYVEKEWWRDAFNEEYLRTDGDCVEDALITEAECVEILRIPDVASIFDKSSMLGSETETETENAARVLDLCCGQGRHSINLAKKYPAVEFHGLDQSKYLIELAVNRAKEAGTGNIVFSIGEARQIPGSDNSFDLVILMGNSFGTYSDDEDNKRLLEEVSRVLKPVGVLLIDLVSAEYTKSNFSPGGWEWIDGGVVGASNTSKTNRRCVFLSYRFLSQSFVSWCSSMFATISNIKTAPMRYSFCSSLSPQLEKKRLLTHTPLIASWKAET